ncbi:MAG: SPFH domain-containing protein [Eubacteriales bacterium]
MGLIKAFAGALGGTLADQWKEFFYCDSLSEEVLVAKGQKRTSRRSSNTKGEENIISNGSGIAVNEGQCMIIVSQGEIVEFCAEAGEFTYDTSTEPSLFTGSLGKGILDTFKTIGRRFTYGGDTGKDQRVYYFNIKEIPGNKYGTASPVPFRVVDRNIGLDVDISIRCNGEYSYKIVDPLLFYKNVSGNVSGTYTRDRIDSMLKTELLTALQPAFAKISEMGVRYSALPGHTVEIADALNEVLSKKWTELRGIKVFSFGINSVTASQEDEEMIKQYQKSAVLRDPGMAAAVLTGAQAQAMQDAAKNQGSGGAFMAFAGMNMAQNAGGINAGNLFEMSARQQAAKAAEEKKTPAAGAWKCSCGAENTGKFCHDCGAAKPAEAGWYCTECGAFNKGKFCHECGAKRPSGAKIYRCDKCGWEPEDPSKPPKFCPECGDPFDDNDVK